jgi:hypothetical protein
LFIKDEDDFPFKFSKVPICPPRTFTATIQWVLEVVHDHGLTSHCIDEDNYNPEGAHRRDGAAFSQSDNGTADGLRVSRSAGERHLVTNP